MTRIRSLAFLGALLAVSGSASAQQFDAGIPTGWTCTGSCGTLGADGVVPLAPGLGQRYGWVSTHDGVPGVSLPGVGGDGEPVDGSRLVSAAFTAAANDVLRFSFDYVTSDGTPEYPDYAWARLLSASGDPVAVLFAARTRATGSIVPGNEMPAPAAVLTPTAVPIIGEAPVWSPLGTDSGTCWMGLDQGCGHTGWIQSAYTIGATGTYRVEFGVTNWSDDLYDSGLAFDGLSLNGQVLAPTAAPEPATVALVAGGLLGLGAVARRRRA